MYPGDLENNDFLPGYIKLGNVVVANFSVDLFKNIGHL